MTEVLHERQHAHVDAGLCVPGLTPRIAVAVIGVAGALLLLPAPFSYLAGLFAVLDAVIPASLGAWVTAAFIAFGQLARTPDAADWRPYAALAVVHLLHVLGALALVVEPFGRMQLRVFARPLRRWLLVQIPAQAVLVGALLIEAYGGLKVGPASGAFAIVAAAGVAVIAVLIIRRR